SILVIWACVFGWFARDATVNPRPLAFGVILRLLRSERLAWALAAFYFLTFGGFVALFLYLPLLLRDLFGLTLADAGFRTAGFVIVAALMRPAGGWLADR